MPLLRVVLLRHVYIIPSLKALRYENALVGRSFVFRSRVLWKDVCSKGGRNFCVQISIKIDYSAVLPLKARACNHAPVRTLFLFLIMRAITAVVHEVHYVVELRACHPSGWVVHC